MPREVHLIHRQAVECDSRCFLCSTAVSRCDLRYRYDTQQSFILGIDAAMCLSSLQKLKQRILDYYPCFQCSQPLLGPAFPVSSPASGHRFMPVASAPRLGGDTAACPPAVSGLTGGPASGGTPAPASGPPAPLEACAACRCTAREWASAYPRGRVPMVASRTSMSVAAAPTLLPVVPANAHDVRGG